MPSNPSLLEEIPATVSAENYEPVWTVGGITYLFESLYLKNTFEKRDFLLTNCNREHTVYISKSEKKRLSEEGFKLIYQDLDSYERKVESRLEENGKALDTILQQNLSPLTNAELAENFRQAGVLFTQMWNDYFWTEHFHTDKVADILERRDAFVDLKRLQSNVDRMGRLKWLQRERNLNRTFMPGGLLDKYMGEISKRLDLRQPVDRYHYKELIDLLYGKPVEIPNREVYAKGKFSGWKDVVGDAARAIIEKLSYLEPGISQLEGRVGNRGKYRGRVRKINFSAETDYDQEIEAMRVGEVLVSGSTGPELILACKKAGAIITDEGGVTSHAAIVSRELNIPCVIGTKVATKVLENGDEVEVNADVGVVRILSKAVKH